MCTSCRDCNRTRDSSTQHLHYIRSNKWEHATEPDRHGTTRRTPIHDTVEESVYGGIRGANSEVNTAVNFKNVAGLPPKDQFQGCRQKRNFTKTK